MREDIHWSALQALKAAGYVVAIPLVMIFLPDMPLRGAPHGSSVYPRPLMPELSWTPWLAAALFVIGVVGLLITSKWFDGIWPSKMSD